MRRSVGGEGAADLNAIRFGAVLENVVIDSQTGEPDYSDIRYTENTRAAYPVEFIAKAVIPGVGGHPNHVLFLAADAFGVLPPIARLNPAQAMYHFLSGYTAKLAGTEAGLGSEPVPEFSTCFASPFIPLAPGGVREDAGRAVAEAQGGVLAGEYRLDWRGVWHW